MNLFDLNLRIQDAERAVEALAAAMRKAGDPGRAALQEAAYKLRSEGARSAAQLLEGQRMEAAYRR